MDNIINRSEEPIPVIGLVDKIKKRKLTISVAESCTGGLVCSDLISVPGVSDIFIEGFITYSNDSKIRTLGIPEELISKHGAVSPDVAQAMAEKACAKSGSDIGLSTTGIAGPGGGTPEKPVGLVYIGVHIKGETYLRRLDLNGTRDEIRSLTCNHLLRFLLEKMAKI